MQPSDSQRSSNQNPILRQEAQRFLPSPPLNKIIKKRKTNPESAATYLDVISAGKLLVNSKLLVKIINHTFHFPSIFFLKFAPPAHGQGVAEKGKSDLWQLHLPLPPADEMLDSLTNMEKGTEKNGGILNLIIKLFWERVFHKLHKPYITYSLYR